MGLRTRYFHTILKNNKRLEKKTKGKKNARATKRIVRKIKQ